MMGKKKKEKADNSLEAEKPRRKFGFGSKVLVRAMILNAVNVVLVILIVILIGKLPVKGQNLKELRGQEMLLRETTDVAVLESEIESNKDKISLVEAHFVDERGVLGFLEAKDQLERDGRIKSFSIGEKPILDKHKNKGLAIKMEFEGSLGEVNESMARVMGLPYFLNPVEVKLAVDPGSDRVLMALVGFLYINE